MGGGRGREWLVGGVSVCVGWGWGEWDIGGAWVYVRSLPRYCSYPCLCDRETRFFQRQIASNYQTVIANGFGTLASWGVVMAPGTGSSDDVGMFLAQTVRPWVAGAPLSIVLPFCLIHTPHSLSLRVPHPCIDDIHDPRDFARKDFGLVCMHLPGLGRVEQGTSTTLPAGRQDGGTLSRSRTPRPTLSPARKACPCCNTQSDLRTPFEHHTPPPPSHDRCSMLQK